MKRNVIIYDKQDLTRIGIESLVKVNEADAIVTHVNNRGSLISGLSFYCDALVILDYTLSDLNGVEEIMNISVRFPKSHWLLFSDELSVEFLKLVIFESTIFSVVQKTSDLNELNAAILQTYRNERFVCSRVTNQLLMANKPQKEIRTILTTTETEILKEIAQGKTTKEIAAVRNLSFHTIITHRKNIFRKLEVNNMYEATKYAMRAGIIDAADYYI